MTSFYIFDKREYRKEVTIDTDNPEVIRGFRAAAHIQWKRNYDEGFYPSSSVQFLIMNVPYRVNSDTYYELRYKNLYFQFVDKDFMQGIITYFETFNLKRPSLDIRLNGTQEILFKDDIELPIPILSELVSEISSTEIEKLCKDNEFNFCVSDAYWINLISEMKFPPTPTGIFPREWYMYNSYRRVNYDIEIYDIDDEELAKLPSLIKYYGLGDESFFIENELYEFVDEEFIEIEGLKSGKNKMYEACENGYFLLIKRLLNDNVKLNSKAANFAASGGRLDIVKWLSLQSISATEGGANKAAKNGHLNVIKWLCKKRIRATEKGANLAARNGHLDVIKWLWDKRIRVTQDGADWAAGNGHLDVVEWLWNKGIRPTEYGANEAALRGHLDVVKFLWDKDIHVMDDEVNWIAGYGKLDVIKWLWDKEIRCTQYGANVAAINGYIDVVKFLWEKDVHATEKGANEAALNGHLDVVKFLWEKGVHATEQGANGAALNGYIDVVKFLSNKGVHATEQVADRTKQGENRYIAKWPVEHDQEEYDEE